MSTATSESRATARTWVGLALLLIPALLVSMDLSVLFVAAPAITEALAPTSAQWLWMMDIYGFVLAGLLVTMGALGDRIGRRKLLLGGALLFGAASALLSLAPTAELFIAGRALLGVAGATLAPSTLSLIRDMFTDPRRRSTAVAAWTTAFTGGAVAGPILGGALLEFFPWGSVFLVNLPFMALLVAAAPFLVPESRGSGAAGFDLPGAAASLVGVLGLVYALKRFTEHGADVWGLAALAGGVLLLALFVLRQRRAAHPLMDITLFSRPAFTAAVGGNTAVAFATAGLGLLTLTFLQTVHGLGPLQAALWSLPTMAGTVLGAVLAGTLSARVRPGLLMAAGLLVGAGGFAVVGTVEPHDPLTLIIGGYTLLTFGIGIVATLANTLVLAAAPPERAGSAAGVAETSSEFGAALGIAVLGTVAAAAYRTGVREALPQVDGAAAETVAGALSEAPRAADPAALLEAAFTAYTDGLTTAALTGAAVLAVVALLAAVALRGLRPEASE
ncbi:MFS transporter [Nocardiopsis algeriensis]|uniref:DHA2 family multidrug resistance protein-like MFS transporter n=1 Tax=Nocardiopsis algeriensis TaxID=1478215 RepID=A0A841IRN0_9ACTN|nr:MFS transporter [Nocardiopsis algeriensis]MBB6118868.1 DHA2 family multidrug resistance protein-like MFS transporter [Nocardiopsis algeriensis]